MKDSISEQRIKLLHPKARDTFKAFIEESELVTGKTFRIVQGLRTIDEQNQLYAQGRTKAGNIVTNAKGGFSYHNYGLAIDIVELIEGKANWNFDYLSLHSIATKHKLKWGGTFKSIIDKPHYELSFGYTIKDLFTKYINKEYIQSTQYVII